MILFLLFSISIPFLSLPAKAAAIVYLPLLFRLGSLPLRHLKNPVKIAGFFSLIILAVRLLFATNADQLGLFVSVIDIGSSYLLFISLGVWISRSISSAELSAKLNTPVRLAHVLAGRSASRFIATTTSIIPVALSLFNKLRGIATAANQAASLRSRKFSLHSVRLRASSVTRLGTELALSTADSLILRGWNPDALPKQTGPTEQNTISDSWKKYFILLPLTLISAVDIFIAILYSS